MVLLSIFGILTPSNLSSKWKGYKNKIDSLEYSRLSPFHILFVTVTPFQEDLNPKELHRGRWGIPCSNIGACLSTSWWKYVGSKGWQVKSWTSSASLKEFRSMIKFILNEYFHLWGKINWAQVDSIVTLELGNQWFPELAGPGIELQVLKPFELSYLKILERLKLISILKRVKKRVNDGILSFSSYLSDPPCDMLSTHHLQFSFQCNITVYSNHHLPLYVVKQHSLFPRILKQKNLCHPEIDFFLFHSLQN